MARMMQLLCMCGSATVQTGYNFAFHANRFSEGAGTLERVKQFCNQEDILDSEAVADQEQ